MAGGHIQHSATTETTNTKHATHTRTKQKKTGAPDDANGNDEALDPPVLCARQRLPVTLREEEPSRDQEAQGKHRKQPDFLFFCFSSFFCFSLIFFFF